MKFPAKLILCVALLCVGATYTNAQTAEEAVTTNASVTDAATMPAAPDTSIPVNAKVYIAPMEGFETYVMAAFRKKNVPLVVVNSRELAQFEITGNSESKKAGWAKTIFGSGLSAETASISVVNIRSGVVAYADSSSRNDALRGKQSTAEKLAKYLKKKIEADAKQARK